MRVALLGTYDTARHPRVGILRDGLRRRGAEVVECNAPLGLTTAERVRILQQPWRLPVLAARLGRSWGRVVSTSRDARRGGHVDAVLVGYLGHFDVHLARVLFPRTTLVLDQLVFAADTARDRGESGSLKQRLLRLIDAGALRAADVVLLDTEEHEALVPPAHRAKTVVVAVGADDTWFDAGAARPGAVDDEPLRVVFFGLFTPLQGAPVIARALAFAPGLAVRLTLVGTGQDWAEVRTLLEGDDRVEWRDWVDPESLPRLVAAHDVCLGVFGTGPKALRVVPNKVFQGAAAGCALVTSDTAPQRRVLGDDALLVPVGDSEAVADALATLVAHRHLCRELGARARARAERDFSPEAVVESLWSRLATPS